MQAASRMCNAAVESATSLIGSRILSIAITQSAFAAPFRAVRLRLDFQIGHQQQIDDVDRVIRLADVERPSAWNRHQEFLVQYRDLATIRQVQGKRTKRLRVIEFSDAV